MLSLYIVYYINPFANDEQLDFRGEGDVVQLLTVTFERRHLTVDIFNRHSECVSGVYS